MECWKRSLPSPVCGKTYLPAWNCLHSWHIFAENHVYHAPSHSLIKPQIKRHDTCTVCTLWSSLHDGAKRNVNFNGICRTCATSNEEECHKPWNFSSFYLQDQDTSSRRKRSKQHLRFVYGEQHVALHGNMRKNLVPGAWCRYTESECTCFWRGAPSSPTRYNDNFYQVASPFALGGGHLNDNVFWCV